MGFYIKVTVSTEGLTQVGTANFGNVAIVGRALGSGWSLNEPYVIQNPADAKALFGETSALYNSIKLAFQNGATYVIAVPTDVEAQTPETFDGDASETEFTLTQLPAQPLDEVTIDSVPVTEGEDFVVDYGNGIVIFNSPPATGVDNISITYSKHTATTLSAALTRLQIEDVQIIIGAMMFEEALLEDIKDHCVLMENDNPRIAFYNLPNGSVDITTAVALLEGKLGSLIAHWQLTDVAAGVAGKASSLRPWKDLTFKPIAGLGIRQGKFTNTQFNTLNDAHVIIMYDPPKDNATTLRIHKGWNLDSSNQSPFVDQVRTAFYIAQILELGLTNPNVIGEMKMNRGGIRELNAYIRALMNPITGPDRAIDRYTILNPAQILFETDNPTDEQIQEIINLQASRSLTDNYAITVECIYSGTIIHIDLVVALTGGV